MSARFSRIESLYHQARLLPPDERGTFLAEACGRDEDLRREVESLLAEHAASGGFLTNVGSGSPLLAPGTRIGVYQITTQIDTGGMAEVYRALDLKLERDVAIKVLPPTFGADPDRLKRFQREARLLAALNHPSIAQIYGLEEPDGVHALVMELVEGDTLADRIARGRIPIAEALPIARQIAEALAAAHEHGIIHRDLKPANVKVRPDGSVKVLDFGLAKCTGPAAMGEAMSSPTPSARSTQPGVILGTAAYMSPEQASGQPVDRRTDLWAFGVVLMEMLTGRRVFDGESTAHVLSSVLKTEPDWTTLPAQTPVSVRRLLRRCLAKDPKRRFDSAADVRIEIEDAVSDPVFESEGTPAKSVSHIVIGFLKRHRFAVAAAGCVVATALIAATSFGFRRPGQTGLDLDTFPNLEIRPLTLSGDALRGAISPDGKFVVYATRDRSIHLRQVSTESDIVIVPADKFRQIFVLTVSPNGDFVDVTATAGPSPARPDVWRIPLLGDTPPIPLIRNVSSGVGWSPNGRSMAFLRESELRKVELRESELIVANADGSGEHVVDARRYRSGFLTAAGGGPAFRPAWSLDGKSIVVPGWSVASDRKGELVRVDVTTGAESVSPANVLGAAWFDDLHFLAIRAGSMPSLYLSDLQGRQVADVTRDVAAFTDLDVTVDRRSALAKRWILRSGIWMSTSTGDTLVNRLPVADWGPEWVQLDSTGGVTYYARHDAGLKGLYYHLKPGASKPYPLVRDAGRPAVSADGRVVVFASGVAPYPLYRLRPDGSDQRTLVEREARDAAITPDGKTVFFTLIGKAGLFRISSDGGGTAVQVSDRWAGLPSVSPDGTRLSFDTDKPYSYVVCEVPACANPRDIQLQVERFVWAPDGLGVVYKQGSQLREQPLDGGSSRVLATFPDVSDLLNFSFSPDGTRLATIRGKHLNDIVLISGLERIRAALRPGRD